MNYRNIQLEIAMDDCRTIVSDVLKQRADLKVKVRQPLGSITIPLKNCVSFFLCGKERKILKDFSEILKEACNVKQVFCKYLYENKVYQFELEKSYAY